MSLEQIAQSLGLPGLLILVWYLLEIQKGKRAEKSDEAKNKIEEAKVAALTLGFQTINTKIDTHERAEFAHHATTREAIVSMHTAMANQFEFTPPPQEAPLPPTRKETPPKGTYFHGRAGTKGGDR
jgi:phytoene dehydrogenase-like protein